MLRVIPTAGCYCHVDSITSVLLSNTQRGCVTIYQLARQWDEAELGLGAHTQPDTCMSQIRNWHHEAPPPPLSKPFHETIPA